MQEILRRRGSPSRRRRWWWRTSRAGDRPPVRGGDGRSDRGGRLDHPERDPVRAGGKRH
ncbi:MAG: hypothetical protein MZV64_19200 [Ignavibacteriales bacterium]|nr:hypothetical protein [Ignavibacteriales bacterium]